MGGCQGKKGSSSSQPIKIDSPRRPKEEQKVPILDSKTPENDKKSEQSFDESVVQDDGSNSSSDQGKNRRPQSGDHGPRKQARGRGGYKASPRDNYGNFER